VCLLHGKIENEKRSRGSERERGRGREGGRESEREREGEVVIGSVRGT
jgi:hypothetical protein